MPIELAFFVRQNWVEKPQLKVTDLLEAQKQTPGGGVTSRRLLSVHQEKLRSSKLLR